MKTKSLFLMVACALFFCQTLLSREISSVEEHTFRLKPDGSITLIGDEGSIKVKSWDKQEVYLKITKRVWDRNPKRAEEMLENLEIQIDHSDDRLYIKEVDIHEHFRFSDIFHSDEWRRHTEHQIDYDLTVPREIDLKIENDEGNVEITEIAGEIRLRIDEGDILLSNLESTQIDVSVDEGDLVCKNIRGATSTLFVNVDEGSVRLSNCEFSTVDLESDEGDFILSGLIFEQGDFESDEGDIDGEIDVLAGGKCRMHTDEGDIFIRVPENIAARIRFQTQEGRIRSDFPMSVRDWGDDGERFNGTVGQGETLIRLNISSDEGNITLKKK